MYNCNLDDAVKNIKTIVENNRCFFCDQLNGPFVRYSCGHSTCSNCVDTAEDCLLCLTPPKASAHVADASSNQRVSNASELLNAFQELFQIDVYRRHRVSEKLKLEKKLFPECIQASIKYCNKKKSFNTTREENKSFLSLPGEKIPLTRLSKMENTVNYVENWLNKNEPVQITPLKNLPRKPFTHLNVNQTINKDANNLGYQTSNKKSLGKKRTHLKIIKADKTPKVGKTLNHGKRVKTYTKVRENEIQEVYKKHKHIKFENNESGIFIDDETISIDNSPREIIDKDRLALLAVLEADKNDSTDYGIESSMNENDLKTRGNFDEANISKDILKTYKVPFFKKSSLIGVCNVNSIKDITKTAQTSKNVTVTIDNDSYVTTINISNVAEGDVTSKTHSTAARTDIINLPSDKTELNLIDKAINVINDKEVKSNESNIIIGKKRKCVIIEESDSDSDCSNENINSIKVTAEVHRPDTIGNGVLCELDQNAYEVRPKHAKRELTPLSSDSSDKENYDPNRIKSHKTMKKNCCKK